MHLPNRLPYTVDGRTQCLPMHLLSCLCCRMFANDHQAQSGVPCVRHIYATTFLDTGATSELHVCGALLRVARHPHDCFIGCVVSLSYWK